MTWRQLDESFESNQTEEESSERNQTEEEPYEISQTEEESSERNQTEEEPYEISQTEEESEGSVASDLGSEHCVIDVAGGDLGQQTVPTGMCILTLV